MLSDPPQPLAASCAPEVAYTTPVEYGPLGVAFDAVRNRLLAVSQDAPDGGHLAVINVLTRARLQTVIIPLGASGVAFDAARNLIYVTGGDWLTVVDGVTYTIMWTLKLGKDMGARGVAYNPANDKLYVTGFDSDTIVIVNVATRALTELLSTHLLPIADPTYVAVNSANNKVYVANHQGGPTGWVTIIDGATDSVIKNLNPSPDSDHGGDLYGIAADGVHNRVYVASVSAAQLYAIDGATDTTLGAIKVVRSSPVDKPIPMRMVAVNPNVGGATHLWLTSNETEDLFGKDRLMVLDVSTWPPSSAIPMATAVAASPARGLIVDPGTGYVFASNFFSDLVTVSQDVPALCATPFNMASSSGLRATFEQAP